MEQCQTDNSLENTNTLATEHTSETKLGTVRRNLLERIDNGDALPLNRAGLHDDLKTRERVGHENINRTDDSRGNETSGRSSQTRLISELGLNVLLQLGLTNETQSSTGKGVTHKRDGTTEQGLEMMSGTLSQNVNNRLDGTRLLEIRALLLLNHANRVDERGRQNTGTGSRDHTNLSITQYKGNSQQNTEFGHTLESNTDQTRSDTRQGCANRVCLKDCIGFRGGDLGINDVSLQIFSVLLHELTVRGDWVVHDGLECRSSKVGRHGLELGEAVFLYHEVIITYEQAHGELDS
mmetsp:Transcript_15603/g.24268  ORF Transcript_15603/g.24268 Transcript_15603/m.24268 type:complete len:294 (-) Transcript_15603:166-1047(-)